LSRAHKTSAIVTFLSSDEGSLEKLMEKESSMARFLQLYTTATTVIRAGALAELSDMLGTVAEWQFLADATKKFPEIGELALSKIQLLSAASEVVEEKVEQEPEAILVQNELPAEAEAVRVPITEKEIEAVHWLVSWVQNMRKLFGPRKAS